MEKGERTLTLSRSVFPVVFRSVMVSTTLNDLADASLADAVISSDDADEALQREADRRKQKLPDAIAGTPNDKWLGFTRWTVIGRGPAPRRRSSSVET
jgi:hypothetical protein